MKALEIIEARIKQELINREHCIENKDYEEVTITNALIRTLREIKSTIEGEE